MSNLNPLDDIDVNDFLTREDKFILDENKNVIPANIMELGKFLKDNWNIKRDILNGYIISTIFLGQDYDYTFGRRSKPLIFETMIFKAIDNDKLGESLEYCKRYATYKEALEGHEKVMQWVKDGCKNE